MKKSKIPHLVPVFLVIPASIILFECSFAESADKEWTLVWSEEFNGPDLNTEIWNFETGTGYGADELQFYTPQAESVGRNYSICQDDSASVLRISALASPVYSDPELGTFDYTSVRLNTQGKFSMVHGKIEARMKLPYGRGIWPAFWMLGESHKKSAVPWPRCGEIDIMELVGGSPHDQYDSLSDSVVVATMHWGDEQNNHFKSDPTGYFEKTTGRFADSYHVFSLEWETEKVRWYVDGKLYFTETIPAVDYEAFQQPFYLLLNLAVGGTWPGPPDETTVFPQNFYIDWIRVYKQQI